MATRTILNPITRPMVPRHGTASGFRWHQRNGEPPCDPCWFAKQEYDIRWRSSPIQTKKNRAHAAAQSAALRRLRHAHLEEYDRYYLEEKERIYKDRGLEI